MSPIGSTWPTFSILAAIGGSRSNAREAASLRRGEVGTNLRNYRVLAALKGTLEQKFLDRIVEQMCRSELYRFLPHHLRTENRQTLQFCMLAQSGCMVEDIRGLCQNYPLRLFEGLESLDNFRQMAEVSKEMSAGRLGGADVS